MTNNNTFDAVLIKQRAEDGFTKNEITDLLEPLNLGPSEEVEPIYLTANSAVIFGFIRSSVSDEKLDFDTSPNSTFGQAVIKVANNAYLENPDGIYDFAGVRTVMYY